MLVDFNTWFIMILNCYQVALVRLPNMITSLVQETTGDDWINNYTVDESQQLATYDMERQLT